MFSNDLQMTSKNHCTVSVLVKRPPKTIVLSVTFANDLRTTSQKHCSVSVFSKRPQETIVLSVTFSNVHQTTTENHCTVSHFHKQPPETIVLAVLFPNDLRTTSQDNCPGCRFFKPPPKTIVFCCDVFKRPSNDLPKPLSWLSGFQTTSRNYCPGCDVFKRPPKGLPKPLYCQCFSQRTSKRPPKPIVLAVIFENSIQTTFKRSLVFTRTIAVDLQEIIGFYRPHLLKMTTTTGRIPYRRIWGGIPLIT